MASLGRKILESPFFGCNAHRMLKIFFLLLPAFASLNEAELAQSHLRENISPPGAARGAVIASPSLSDPPYFYHWIRDAALVMDQLNPQDESDREMLRDYARFSRQNQQTLTLTGLGEPKFNADGTAFNLEWGRPQNDGPALRALTLMRYRLSTADKVADEVIWTDLDYIAGIWLNPSYDLWEESLGEHFYTLMVQRAALETGARFAWDIVGDGDRGNRYQNQASRITQRLEHFWDSSQKRIVATRTWSGVPLYKIANLDTAVVLAVLHSRAKTGSFSLRDDRVAATVVQLEDTFRELYPLNRDSAESLPLPPAMGRYPEDLYDGATNIGGNPWFLITLGFGEFYLKKARALTKDGQLQITSLNLDFYQRLVPPPLMLSLGHNLSDKDSLFHVLIDGLRTRGEGFLTRAKRSAGADGRLSEQFHRSTGQMTSARDLTWSYAALLSFLKAR